MKLADIIAKVLKGESLSDDEKAFLTAYDEQKALDTAAASARKKAESERKAVEKSLEEANSKIADLTEKLEAGEAGKKAHDTELGKLQRQVAKLMEQNAAAEAKLKANERMATIREAAKSAGITAAKGVSAAALEKLIDLAVGETDVTDGDALKAVLDAFKAENPAMIAAEVKPGATVPGKPAQNSFTGTPNPWKAESFNLTKQIEIATQNPELAASMKVEAGAPA